MLNNVMGVYGVQIDLKTAQLLNSRLFHDLVGAVSAVNTGIEFMAEPGSDEDAAHLLKQSADRLTRRLDFFRAAFGLGGGKQGELSLRTPVYCGWLVRGFQIDPCVAQQRCDDGSRGCGTQPVKVLMILSMMAEECLPRGGEVPDTGHTLPRRTWPGSFGDGQGARAPDGTFDALNRELFSKRPDSAERDGLLWRSISGKSGSADRGCRNDGSGRLRVPDTGLISLRSLIGAN